MRRLGLDADRGLGRQHRHPHPRRARLRHAAPLRAGRRARPAAHAATPPNEDGLFEPEYAEVYGVPFSFIPVGGSSADPKPGPMPTRVRALDEPHRLRDHLPAPDSATATSMPDERLTATFTDDSHAGALDRRHARPGPRTRRSSARSSIHTLDDLEARREQEVAFLLAKLVLEKYFRDEATERPFDEALALPAAARHRPRAGWRECVTCKDDTFPQTAAARSSTRTTPPTASTSAIVARRRRASRRCMPILRPYDTIGSTRYVDFDTTKPVYATDPEQVPHLPRRRRHRLVGAEDGPGARGDGRGRRATSRTRASASPSRTPSSGEEHNSTSPTSSPASTTATARTICST